VNIKPIQQHIDEEFNGSNALFCKHIGKTNKQVCRYIEMGAWWVNGAVVQIKCGEISQEAVKAVISAKS